MKPASGVKPPMPSMTRSPFSREVTTRRGSVVARRASAACSGAFEKSRAERAAVGFDQRHRTGPTRSPGSRDSADDSPARRSTSARRAGRRTGRRRPPAARRATRRATPRPRAASGSANAVARKIHLIERSAVGDAAVKELARVERAAHEALRLLDDARMLDADRGLQRRLRPQARVAHERRDAADEPGEREHAARSRAEAATSAGASDAANAAASVKPDALPEQHEVDDGQRRRPFAQEREARVDHRRCRRRARRSSDDAERSPIASVRRQPYAGQPRNARAP